MLRKKGEEAKREGEENSENWDVLQHLPPSCPPVLPAEPGAAAGPLYPQLPQQREQENVVLMAPPENNSGVGGGEQRILSPHKTRRRTQLRISEAPWTQETEVHQMPLCQIPLEGQGGGFEFVIVPLTTQDIKALKK